MSCPERPLAIGDSARSLDCPALVEDDDPEPSSVLANFVLFFSLLFPDLETFIGLALAAEWALLDTGAQHAVVGPEAWARMSPSLPPPPPQLP